VNLCAEHSIYIYILRGEKRGTNDGNLRCRYALRRWVLLGRGVGARYVMSGRHFWEIRGRGGFVLMVLEEEVEYIE
jgi:hypothetical protein